MRIAIVAPSCTLKREAAKAGQRVADRRGDCELLVHPQCFCRWHFAGSDEARLNALRDVMSDPDIDAVWFARGGYGSNRIAEAALQGLADAARPSSTWAIAMRASCSPAAQGRPGGRVGPDAAGHRARWRRGSGGAGARRGLSTATPKRASPSFGSRQWRSTSPF
jgi:hypothetical protein